MMCDRVRMMCDRVRLSAKSLVEYWSILGESLAYSGSPPRVLKCHLLSQAHGHALPTTLCFAVCDQQRFAFMDHAARVVMDHAALGGDMVIFES